MKVLEHLSPYFTTAANEYDTTLLPLFMKYQHWIKRHLPIWFVMQDNNFKDINVISLIPVIS
jgi:hypothetical protein